MHEGANYRKELQDILRDMRGSPQGDECPISMEPFTESSRVVVLECYHMMEKAAWDQFVASRGARGELVCPICRHPCVQIPC